MMKMNTYDRIYKVLVENGTSKGSKPKTAVRPAPKPGVGRIPYQSPEVRSDQNTTAYLAALAAASLKRRV